MSLLFSIFFVFSFGFSEEERSMLGRIGTVFVFLATFLAMLGLIHDPRVKEGEKYLRSKIERIEQSIISGDDVDSETIAKNVAYALNIDDIRKELSLYERYPGTIRRVVPFAVALLGLGTAFMMLSYG